VDVKNKITSLTMITLNTLYRQRLLMLYGPVLVMASFLLVWGITVYKPLPPRLIAIAAGNPQGGYMKVARRYVQLLSQQGLQVQIVNSTSWTGILDMYTAPVDAAPVQAGFAQGMYSQLELPDTRALAVIGREPLWIYARAAQVRSLKDLHGKRIGLGPAQTSTHMATLRTIEAAGLDIGKLVLSEASGVEAVSMLLEDKLDAVGFVLGEDSQPVQMANNSEDLILLGVENSAELMRLEPRLRTFVLPQGALELRSDIPSRDLLMVATQTHLVVRETLHPATQRLLLRVAKNVHDMPSFLQGQGEFPASQGSDFTLASQARVTPAAHPLLEKVLPYWWAQLIDLILSWVIPVLLFTAALLYAISRSFDWRVNGQLQRLYGQVSFLQDEVNALHDRRKTSQESIRAALQQLDELDQRAIKLALPQRFADRAYTLRQHLTVVRMHFLGLMKTLAQKKVPD
jgi:TRAP-type uncharacterized transport system substrate-binding protein